ncbi:hypothetical protein PPL_01769 [Heterostelium album PN500]|uniref:EGF-like domain-containing protein n=1 Tax=Heterostelium pallidum (strain ATCC 26659 / Pp 5 / PN500) TaxID=670386 RepID=D3B0F3_HETP5|nr:hypothetical protein PPL_01769 [Heterostelium album PN500]EFA84777.1 hypothetical protein PPL_01769 [Heterostelium album PN500]|eukprot:XP_020436889.1 hypothetical protein PPL_01769 [Heterostelium album PN500]
MIKYLLLLVFSLNVFQISSQLVLDQNVVASIKWIMYQYSIPLNSNGFNCSTLAEGYIFDPFICSPSPTNSSEEIVTRFSPNGVNTPGTIPNPGPITKLYFPDLETFQMNTIFYIKDTTISLFEMFDQPENKKLKVFSLSVFPNLIMKDGFPKYIPFNNLYCSVCSISPYVANSALTHMSTLTWDGNSIVDFDQNSLYPNLSTIKENFPELNNFYSSISYMDNSIITFDTNSIKSININHTPARNTTISLGRATNLLALYFRNVRGSVEKAKNLNKLSLNYQNLTIWPPISWFSTTKVQIDLSNNLLAGNIPDYSSLVLGAFNVQNNPGINGRIPDYICLVESINFLNTSITEAPDLIQFDKTNFIFFGNIPQSAFTITGKNLGYKAPPPTILVRANTAFLYYVNGVKAGSVTLTFNNKTQTFTWYTDVTQISYANFNQVMLPNVTYNLGIFGTFDTTLTYSVSDFETVLIRVNFSILASIIVTSYSPINRNGGAFHIDGFFGSNPEITVSVYLDNKECKDIVKRNLTIDCNVAGPLTVGYVPLLVTVGDGSSLTTVKVDDAVIPNDCGEADKCSGNGVCIEKKCKCNEGYGGNYCDLKLGNGTIVTNLTTPSASFVAENVQFDFNIYSIQEVDSSDNVVKELNVTQWRFRNDTEGEITNLYYYLNVSYPNVTTMIQYSPKERTVEFAGITSYLPPNSLKVSITITGWLFRSNLNVLRVVFNTKIEDQVDECGDKLDIFGTDINNDLKYLRITKDKTVFYGSFLDRIMSDGKPTATRNQVISTDKETGMTLIGIQLPQCYDCIIDPNFSVLVENGGECV